jgi:hypothetical protein
LSSLRALRSRLWGHVLPTASAHRSAASAKYVAGHFRSVLASRAYFYGLYFEFQREPDVDPLTRSDVFAHIFITETVPPSAPGVTCAQVVLRTLKQLRADPDTFAASLVRSRGSVPPALFAFSTFPAIFHGFCNAENVAFGASFVRALLRADAPSDVLAPMFLVLLFANFAFVDALWSNFHRANSQRQRILEPEAVAALCASIEACAPLISAPVHRAIQEVRIRCPDLCCSAVLRFISVSFDLWYCHSAEGMSFGCGESFAAFLSRPRDGIVGNAVMNEILPSMLRCSKWVPVTPSHAELPRPYSEFILFSSWDFGAFRRAFEGARVPLFDKIELDDAESRFAPYLLEHFPLYTQDTMQSLPIFSLEGIPDVCIVPDPIFEAAIMRKLTLSGPTFEEYSLKRSIAEAKEQMGELEELLLLKLCMRKLRVFQRSILRFSDCCFSRYCSSLFKSIDFRTTKIEAIAEPFLSTRCARSLVRPFLAGLLNFVEFGDPPKSAKTKFIQLKRDHMAAGWREMSSFRGMRKIIEIVGEPTRRPLSRWGDIFQLWSHVFWSVHKICNYFGASSSQHRKLVKCLSLNCEFEDILKVFMFFDGQIIQKGYFTTILKQSLVRDWSLFIAIMYETIAKDITLCAEITECIQ